MKGMNRTIKIYLTLIFVVCYGLGAIELITRTGIAYEFLGIGFTFFPVSIAMITKRITGEKAAFTLSLKVWKNMKAWLFSAFVPGILIVLGSTLCFLLFKKEFSGVFQYGQLIGTDGKMTINNIFIFAVVCIIISALMFPIQLLELGEEIGWRGYLLGCQVEKYGERKAVLINVFLYPVKYIFVSL